MLFIVPFIKFLVQLPHSTQTPAQRGQDLNIFTVVLTALVLAVPEGLSLAVTLALGFRNRML